MEQGKTDKRLTEDVFSQAEELRAVGASILGDGAAETFHRTQVAVRLADGRDQLGRIEFVLFAEVLDLEVTLLWTDLLSRKNRALEKPH